MRTRRTKNDPAAHSSSLVSGVIGFGSATSTPVSSDAAGRAAPGTRRTEKAPVLVCVTVAVSISTPALRSRGDRYRTLVVFADQANLMRMNTTKPMSASASVNAMPRNMVVRTMPAASG